jgi:phosphoglycerate dehydrogenase-like enzyme
MVRPWRMLYTDAGEFPLASDLIQRAEQAGIKLELLDGHDRDDIAAHGTDCHGIFLYRARIDDDLLAMLPNCRVLARVGTGYDLIDVSAARRRGIVVTYVPNFCTEELSDMVMLFILVFARQLPHLMDAARQHHWLSIPEIPIPKRLVGQTLGILGFGHSGQRTAAKARMFGLEVCVWTRTPKHEAIASLGARETSFAEALSCDYVSLHLPLTPETARLIDCEALANFKRTSILINIARGALVDTTALVDALQRHQLGGAALDVVDPEPLPPTHPLWNMPNVLITSHSACLSAEALRESQTTAIDDAAAVLHGRQPAHPVP